MLCLASGAGAITVQADTVDPGDSWDSGGLSFTGFEFNFGAADASAFTLTIEGTRVTLAGPMEVEDIAIDVFEMTYSVFMIDFASRIEGVSLDSPTEIQDNGFPTFMSAVSNFDDASDDPVGSLGTTVFGSTDEQLASTAIDPQVLLKLQTGAQLRSSQNGDFVTLLSMSNEFSVVPEPSTGALLALGLMTLAARRPRS
jgi:hypothetical protein